jgi:RNA polymerase sigma-70 factor, ECF subfamily
MARAVSDHGDGPPGERAPEGRVASFDEVYEQHVAFLYRSARAFGVGAAAADDVIQDVFVVVHRKLAEHDGRGSIRTWLLRILFNVVREHRRRFRRQPESSPEVELVAAPAGLDPEQEAEVAEAGRLLLGILHTMDDEQRRVFVLAEMEGLAVPEIAEAMGATVNTTYSRLRLARRDYGAAVARIQARDGWRSR